MKRLAAVTLSLGLMAGMFSGPLAQPAQAASLKVCGEVTVYVQATLLATGSLTINGVPFVILAGVSLPASIAVGADLCLDLTTNLLGLITGAAVTANVHTHVKVCGTVTAYTAATASATGLLKFGSNTFVLGIGSHLPAAVAVGADLCIDLDIDAFGRVADGVVTANAHVSLKVCGEVTAYAKATATTTGLLKIGSRTWILAVGSVLPASVVVGADLCIDLEIDGYGRVSDGEVTVNVETHVKVCGEITAYVKATASATGLLKLAGRTFVLAIDSELPANVTVGADLCLDLTLNGFAQVKDGSAVANVTATLDVCGQITAYVAATATADGSLTLAGIFRKVAAGADVDAAIGVGAFIKLRLEIDVFARIAKATVLKVGVSLDDACGSTAPQPTDGPGATQGSGASQDPGASQSPGESQAPGASDAPTATDAPAGSSAPDATPGPTQDVGGSVDSCVSGVDGGDGTLDGTLLPDTDALGRATGVVAANILPLLAIGLVGGLAAWYRSHRRRDEDELVSPESIVIDTAASHDQAASEDRS